MSLLMSERMGMLAPLNDLHSFFVHLFPNHLFAENQVRPQFERVIQFWRAIDFILDPGP